MTMSSPDANKASRSESPSTVDIPATRRGLDVTVHFDRASVWRTGLVLAGVGAGLLLFLWLFSMLSHFLFLLVLAWLLATALEPGIRWFVQRGRSRGRFDRHRGRKCSRPGPRPGRGLRSAVLQPGHRVRARPARPDHLGDQLREPPVQDQPRPDHDRIELHLDPTQITVWAGSLSGGVLGVVGSLSSILFDLVTVLVFGFYFAGAGPKLIHSLASWMPPRVQEVFITITEITIAKTGGYVVSKIVLAAASAFFHGIFFAAIGVPYWLPFALFAGITSQFVPIIGTYLGVILPVLATVFGSPWKAVAIIAFAAVYQQIETYYFTPRVSNGRWTSTPPSHWEPSSSARRSGAPSAR